ncbi:hypothetical protein FJZ26_04925, partial [Candidatus Parvarchaeota archaeon]|nr:hypothetical protein [Candidatus Parvarchaeota archaeon]
MEKLFAIFAFAVLLLSGCIDKPTYEGRAFENEPQENKEWEGPDGSYPRENNRKISPVQNAPDTYVKPQLQDIKQTPASDCKKPAFTEYLVDTKYLNQVGQVGTVHGSGHFTIERSYISVKSEYERQKIPIYAPANMTLARGSYYQVPAPQGQYLGEPMPDYALYFDAGCGVEVALGHLKEAVPKIASQFS